MISPEEFVERVCRLGAEPGPRPFPRRRRDREILMKSVVMQLDSGRSYREPEINELLEDWLREVAPEIETDHVTLRRLLVDWGYLERTASGSRYRVGFPPGPAAFELEVEDIDVRATVAAYVDHRARRKRERRARAGRASSA